jgi:hypothetical protein
MILILGLYTKRAHLPFGRWLPEAMAAPTPVSTNVDESVYFIHSKVSSIV